TEMIVWGGLTCVANQCGGYEFNTGARYNPSTDTWTPLSVVHAPSALSAHAAVWTGTEMIVWGGWSGSSAVNTGGRYNPTTDTWSPLPTTNAPTGRVRVPAVWTGSEMLIWGGDTCTLTPSSSFNTCVGQNTGARYRPSTDS